MFHLSPHARMHMTRRRAICNSNTKGGPTTYQYQSNQSLLLFSFKALIPNILRKTFKLRQFEMFWSFFLFCPIALQFLVSLTNMWQSKTLQGHQRGERTDQKISNDLSFTFYSKCDYGVSIASKKMYLLFQEENSLRIQIFIFEFCDLDCIACKRVSMEITKYI